MYTRLLWIRSYYFIQKPLHSTFYQKFEIHLRIYWKLLYISALPPVLHELCSRTLVSLCFSTVFFSTCASLQRYGLSFDFPEPPIKKFDENASINLNYAILENKTVLFQFVHAYKIRYSDNSSLVTNFLGSWCLNSWSLNNPISVKLRSEFKGQPIIFGVLNGTTDRQMDENEEEANDIAPLLDFATFVTSSVNARYCK